jgi:UrcA family protein
MFSNKFAKLLCGSAAIALGSLSLLSASPVSAQDNDQSYYDNSTDVGGLIVVAPPRQERSFNGAPIERVAVRRHVNVSDLDLGTSEGMHILKVRVRYAARSACDELDNAWVAGYVPAADQPDNCYRVTVRRAMRNAQMAYAANY